VQQLLFEIVITSSSSSSFSSESKNEPEAMARSVHSDNTSNDGDATNENRRVTLGGNNEDEEPLTYAEFEQRASNDPRRLFRLIALRERETDQATEELNEQIQRLEEQLRIEITAHAKDIDEHKEQVIDLIKERDRFKDAVADLAVRFTMEPNPGGNTRGTPTPDNRKSVKLPDPPLLTDGKDPKFEDWLHKMQNKLSANADHYNTEALRRAYVANRVGGKASDHLAPRLRDDAPNRFETAEEMFQHLKSIFLDPNRALKAKHKLRFMTMKPSNKFHDFLTDFLFHANEANMPESEYKSELYQRLTPRMKELTLQQWISKTTSFNDFSEYCMQVSHTLEQNYQDRKSAPSDEKLAKKTNDKRDLRGKNNSDTTSGIEKLDKDERQILMKEGKCFNCKEKGHLSRDCPLKNKTLELKALETLEGSTVFSEIESGKESP
jgi:hypothetical protein